MDNETKLWVADTMMDEGVSIFVKAKLLKLIRDDNTLTIFQMKEFVERTGCCSMENPPTKRKPPIIHYGNIWSRLMYYEKEGDYYKGHTHQHDHITFVSKGGVMVQVEGYHPKSFFAPAWIAIPAKERHQFVALKDDTHCYCVHAIRDEDGEPVEIYDMSNVVKLTPIQEKKNGTV